MIGGCAGPQLTYVDESQEYDSASAADLVEQADAGKLAEKPSSAASELRHEYLVALRSRGEGAAEAAALITRTFPAEVEAVPFYVERAVFGSETAFVVVEAMGRPGGKLSDKRFWVIDEQGNVLLSGTR
jgi:hypothetical protein